MVRTYSKLKLISDVPLVSQTNKRFNVVSKTHPRPQLIIKGRWLEQIGFYVGCPVIIKIEQGKLIVELDLQV